MGSPTVGDCRGLCDGRDRVWRVSVVCPDQVSTTFDYLFYTLPMHFVVLSGLKQFFFRSGWHQRGFSAASARHRLGSTSARKIFSQRRFMLACRHMSSKIQKSSKVFKNSKFFKNSK